MSIIRRLLLASSCALTVVAPLTWASATAVAAGDSEVAIVSDAAGHLDQRDDDMHW